MSKLPYRTPSKLQSIFWPGLADLRPLRAAFLTLVALSLLILLLFARTSFGQEPAEPETFAEAIDVRVVNLDIVVTDRRGERVPNLGPEDFELKVDGEPMPIDYFSEIREGRAVARSGEGGPREAPLTAAGEPVPTRFLLFIDGAFGIPKAYQRFEESIGDQVDSLAPHEEMAIVYFNGNKIELLSDWTSSARQLREALRSIDLNSFDGHKRLRDWKSYQGSIREELIYVAETGVRGDPATPLADLPEYGVTKKQLERNIERISKAASAALYRFSEVGGRKIAILWSGGWPWSSLEFLRPPWSRDATSGARSERSLKSIIDTANRLGYTLYLADTSINFYDGNAERMHHESLDLLAAGTGGEAYKQFASLDALDRSREDARSYYWLGFTAQGDGSGDRFKIKLKAKQRGLKVRTRKSWLDLPKHEEINQKVEALALFGAQDTNGSQRALELEFGEPEVQGRRILVPMVVGIPLTAITMLPGVEGFNAELEVRVSVIDEDGALNEMPVIPLQFSGPAPRQGDIFYYETQLKMRQKSHEITVAVHDSVSGEIIVGRQDLDL